MLVLVQVYDAVNAILRLVSMQLSQVVVVILVQVYIRLFLGVRKIQVQPTIHLLVVDYVTKFYPSVIIQQLVVVVQIRFQNTLTPLLLVQAMEIQLLLVVAIQVLLGDFVIVLVDQLIIGHSLVVENVTL